MSLPVSPGGVAAAAYRASMGAPGATPTGGATEGNSFGDALSRAGPNAVNSGHQADAASTRNLRGEGSVTDLVVAVGRAELTLQTAVAVRDRVVSAYQEVMRMPI